MNTDGNYVLSEQDGEKIIRLTKQLVEVIAELLSHRYVTRTELTLPLLQEMSFYEKVDNLFEDNDL